MKYFQYYFDGFIVNFWNIIMDFGDFKNYFMFGDFIVICFKFLQRHLILSCHLIY